jgi:DNA invertase Pin-like site-specific DNA recombinase
MSIAADQKVTASHLQRNAYLYVRQSTLRQVFENTESTKRQYALRQKAIALGWPTENVIVIDSDLGQSGASAADREGFQRLVTEVGVGRAGIVLGLEVSRLARNSTDWHRLLEICALTDTLILDEDGLYDPSHFNDRLLLGLKGTMSEAELHVLRARLRGGIESKARRGELKSPLPIGFNYDEEDRVVLEADRHRQQDAAVVDDSTRSHVLELATNFPKLWKDPRTSDRDRKRIVRLLMEDVTLLHAEQLTAHVRFQGGVVETLHLPRPLTAWQQRQTSPQVLEAIDRLLDEFTEGQIADQLNQQGLCSGMGSAFCGRLVAQIRRAHQITNRYDRLRSAGMLTQEEVARELGIHPCTVRKWRTRGLLAAHAYNDKNECLYDPLGALRPIKQQGIKLTDSRRFNSIALQRTDEVQHEA